MSATENTGFSGHIWEIADMFNCETFTSIKFCDLKSSSSEQVAIGSPQEDSGGIRERPERVWNVT